jgi:hypothetical protein
MATEAPGSPPQTLEAAEPGRNPRKWTLRLFPEGLRGERQDDGASVHVLRPKLPDVVQVHDGLLLKRTLVVKKPRRTTLQLDPDGFRRLSRWIGGPTLLRMALKRRLSWTIPIGILFVVISVPLPGDLEAGIEAVPFNPVSAVLGTALIVQGVASRLWPRPVFFLLDALWFCGLAADTVYRVTQGQRPYWLVFVVLQVGLAVGGLRLWRRFQGTSDDSTQHPRDDRRRPTMG